ncbi:MAG TPA: hypothetical protein VMT46_19250 [Anaerolineaceae bacterium]|nr:hypothetical protein [Anaerolineaceae bacterium]
MWRHRPFLDLGLFGRGRRLPRHLAGLSELELLNRANREQELSNFLEAAQIYEVLSEKTLEQKQIRSGYLFLQSGRSYIQADQTGLAMDCIKQGLSILAKAGRMHMIIQVGNRIVSELNYRDRRNEAQLVTNWLDVSLNGSIQAFGRSSIEVDPTRPRLPLKCLLCGGTLIPNEVEWLDQNTAECPYCGSPIRGGEGG